ncbi:MAG: metallopeptidase TldD-related protein [Bryobacteraceae bacterium]|jgi:predicted Zn-dependent protease
MRIATLLGLLAAALPAAAQDDVLMRAMRDEMARSMKELQLANLEKPYFIAYRATERDDTGVGASFGALSHSNSGRSRMFSAVVRVGDYKFDNTNFFSMNFGMGAEIQTAFLGNTELPLDNDYKELRRQIWLATDSAYKKAVEDISKKRAALQNKNRDDDIPDFSHETPVTTIDIAPPVQVDRVKWEATVRALSALFRQAPEVYTSSVSLNAANTTIRYLDSEGFSYTRSHSAITFDAAASTQAPDGGQIEDSTWLYAHALAELPGDKELSARVVALGREVSGIRSAQRIENYNGPVLFEDDAAVQAFRLAFVPDLVGTHPVISDMPNQGGQAENPFLDKIGARVLPAFLSVTDNPTLAEFNGTRMAGFSKVDEDGLATRETRLVEKGILKTLLTSRDPVRGIEHSTGSRHAGQAAPSNIIVTCENGLSAADLRAKFMELVKERDLPYGILVRRMRTGNTPLLISKAFPDGHEEAIRGVQFVGLNTTAFKEIVAAGKDQHMLTVQYRPRATPFLFSLGGEGWTPLSLAVPSLLFEDLTIRKARGATPNPPVAKHPFFDK